MNESEINPNNPSNPNNSNNPQNKPIRFINSDYQELFTIPDGGHITITKESGEELTRKCEYIDETHVKVGNQVYHVRQFAEINERNGNAIKPCSEPEVIAGYKILDKMPIGDKVIALAHNPKAVQPWVTWQGRNDRTGYDWGHYWGDKSKAWSDYLLRSDSVRTGKVYDHTKLYESPKSSRSKNGAR